MTVELAVWVMPLIAFVSYLVGIFTEKRVSSKKSAGEILLDNTTGKILFNFSIMPEDLDSMDYILMKVRKVNLVDKNDNSDSDDET